MTPTARLNATLSIAFVAIFLASAFPLTTENVSAHAAHPRELVIDRPDPAVYFGFDDLVGIRVIDPDRDTAANTRTAEVNATVGTTKTKLTLYETFEPNGDNLAGTYVGHLRFASVAGAANTIVVPSTATNLSVTLSWDPGAVGAGGGAAIAKSILWQRTYDAVVDLTKGGLFDRYVGRNATAGIRVTDLDHVGAGDLWVAVKTKNLAWDPDANLVRLYEECKGTSVATIPCAAGKGTGRFFGNVSFRPAEEFDTPTTLDDVDGLYLGTGDNSRLVYNLGSPFVDASLSLVASNYLKPHLGGSDVPLLAGTTADYTITPAGKITLTTAGKTKLGTRDLVASYDVPTPTATTPGVFFIPVQLEDPNFGPDPVDRLLTESFRVEYQDVRDATGMPILRTARGEWIESEGAQFFFLNGDLVSPLTPVTAGGDTVAHLLGTQSKLGLRVFDDDANANAGVADTIVVRVSSFLATTPGAAASSFREGDEETVTLTESGPNTGEFLGTIGLETVRTANSGKLRAISGIGVVTVITGSYAEARADSGAARGAMAAPMADGDSSTPPITKADRIAFTATASGTTTLLPPVGTTAAAQFFGLGDDLARVRIFDADITAKDQLLDRVVVRSSAGTETLTLPAAGFTAVAGGWEQMFGFEPAGDANATNLLIPVVDGSRVTVEYRDPMNAVGQLEQLVPASAVWKQAFDASVAFGGRFFLINENVPIVVQDPDLDASDVSVLVVSSEDFIGVSFTLHRDPTSPVPGTYRGFAKFETPQQALVNDRITRNDFVAVANEGTARVFYEDPRLADGRTDEDVTPDVATILHQNSGAVELASESIVLGVPADVVARDGNAGSGGHDILANVTSHNSLLDGSAAASADDVRDPGEPFRFRMGIGVTTATSKLSTEGGRVADTFTATGGPNQKYAVSQAPFKPCDGVDTEIVTRPAPAPNPPREFERAKECLDGPKVYVDGVEWKMAYNNSFGKVPAPNAITGIFDCTPAPVENCQQEERVVLDHTWGKIEFGAIDDPGAWPLNGQTIVVVYEPYELYTEVHKLAEAPHGSDAKALQLHNRGKLAGLFPSYDGTPASNSGTLLVNCRDDPDTPTGQAGEGNEVTPCFVQKKLLLHGNQIVSVKVNGEEFEWCPTIGDPRSASTNGPCQNVNNNRNDLRPGTKQFTFNADGRFWLGSPAAKGSNVEISYRSFDLFSGSGRDYTVVGAVDRPTGDLCQVSKLDGGDEDLLLRTFSNTDSKWQYFDDDANGVVRFNSTLAGTRDPDLGDRILVRPRADNVIWGDEGNGATAAGHRVYRAENFVNGGLQDNEIRFRLQNPRVCTHQITSNSAGTQSGADRLELRVVFSDVTDPQTGNPVVVPGKNANDMFACIKNLNPQGGEFQDELYRTGIVRIKRDTSSACSNLDENSAFQVQYRYGTTDTDLMVNQTIRRGLCVSSNVNSDTGRCNEEALPGVPLKFPSPMDPETFEVRFDGDLLPEGPGATDVIDVNPRTGTFVLKGATILPGPDRVGILDELNFQGRLVSRWNNEVAVGPDDRVMVTYFDPSNSLGQAARVDYNITAIRSVTKGEVEFRDANDDVRTEFFGLADYANVTVVDEDRNRDPARVETLTLRLKAIAVSRLGPDTGLPTFNGEITLFEESADSDTFRARLKLGPLSGTRPVGLNVLGLNLEKGNQFLLVGEYTDLHQPVDGTAYQPVIVTTAQYRPATRGQLSVDPLTKLGLASQAKVTVVDADRDGRMLQERVGVSTGAPSQSMSICGEWIPAQSRCSVDKRFRPDSQIVWVEEMQGDPGDPAPFSPRRFEAWKQVTDPTSPGNLNGKVYSIDPNTGTIRFGTCKVEPESDACIDGIGQGRVPVENAEVRVDYFQRDGLANNLFVRIESYVVDPLVPFDVSRDAHPEAPECQSAQNPRCYDRLDLALPEISAGTFQQVIPFSNVQQGDCSKEGAIICPYADPDGPGPLNAGNATKLELPNPTPGVDQAVVVVTYFDYSYTELFRKRTEKPVLDVCPGDGNGKPGEPFQQLMAGQVFPGFTAGSQDSDCQVAFGHRDLVQKVISFREATDGQLDVSSRSMLLHDGTVDVAGADDFARSQRAVYGQGEVLVALTDAELNKNREAGDLASVNLVTESNLLGASFSLNEQGGDAGVFLGKAGLGPGGAVAAAPRGRYSVAYIDEQDANGQTRQLQVPDDPADELDYRWFPSTTGTPSLSRAAFIEDGPSPVVTLVDSDRNVNVNLADTLKVLLSKVNLTSMDVDSDGDAEVFYGLGVCPEQGAPLPAGVAEVTLRESGANSDVFRSDTTLDTAVASLSLEDSETLLVTYCDPHDAEGHEGPLAACAIVASDLCRVGTGAWSLAKFSGLSRGLVSFDKARYVDRAETATITVRDQELSGSTDKVPVVVQFGTTSIKLDLVENGGPGVFTGKIGFQEVGKNTDGIQDIQVLDNQPIRVYYVDTTVSDQAAPLASTGRPAASFAEALFAKDVKAPTTTSKLTSSVEPVVRSGASWFRSPPSITLTAVDDLSGVASIEYWWDSATSHVVAAGAVAGPFSPPSEGVHVLHFFAKDVVGNPEKQQNLSVNWDQTPPALAVTQLNVTLAPKGIQLAWASPVDRNDPLQFGEFQVFRDVQTGTAAAVATTATVFVSAPDEKEHTYFVRIVDAAGNAGPFSTGVKAIADITPPTVTAATVLPKTTFEVGDVTKLDLSVKVVPTLDDIVAKVEVAVKVPGAGTDLVTMTDPDGDDVYTGSYANLTRTGLYELVFHALDRIGNDDPKAFTINVTGRDDTSPTLGPIPLNLVVPQGEALRLPAVDNIGITRVTFRMDGGAERTEGASIGNGSVYIPTEGLALGPHVALVRVFDKAGNSAAAEVPFRVTFPPSVKVPPPPEPPRFIAQSGAVVVTWVMVPSAFLDHFEIWRAASPEKKLGDVDPDDCPQGQCRFVDRSAKAGVEYTYCILAVNSTGAPTGSADYPSKACMQASCATCVEPSSGFLERFWWVFLIAAAIVVGVAVFLVQREERAKKTRSRQRLETVPVGPGERHHLKCPACSTRFTVTGTKPIVTNCPHCGKKGILR